MQKLGFILSAAGIASAVTFTIISGLHYRYMEDHGLEPGYSPLWIVLGTYFGLFILALGLIVSIGNLLISFVRKAKPRQ